MKAKNITLIIIRLIVALILLQTLYFKFSGHEESVALFTKLGVEPVERITTGVIDFIVSILLLLHTTVWLGALVGIGVMAGAIASHIFVIGIASAGDGGQLFMLAWIVLLLCLILISAYKQEWKFWRSRLKFFKAKEILTILHSFCLCLIN